MPRSASTRSSAPFQCNAGSKRSFFCNRHISELDDIVEAEGNGRGDSS